MSGDVECFDVVVVGAGPAGGQCARSLAKSGQKVLLVEQYDRFEINDFSSAGTPIETLKLFELPDSIVGSFWNKIIIEATNISRSWHSEKTLGAVLNFAKLRAFLAREVELQGGQVWMGCRYVQHQIEGNDTLVTFKKRSNRETLTVHTKVLVDATGPMRAVMYPKQADKPEFLSGTGLEYLIEVSESNYQRYADALVFFLGHKWMPKGYSWIFPMENNRLKVGAGRLNERHQIVKDRKPLKYYIELIIQDYLKIQDYTILDKHGSTLQYSRGLNDIYYRDNVIAIGDAVSTVNFLGGEGIRHGMYSADLACDYIQKYLKQEISDFQGYQKAMYDHFRSKWNLSEKLGMRKYLEDSDERIDQGVRYLGTLKAADLMAILFDYQFEKVSKGVGQLLKRKLKEFALKLLKNFNWKPLKENKV